MIYQGRRVTKPRYKLGDRVAVKDINGRTILKGKITHMHLGWLDDRSGIWKYKITDEKNPSSTKKYWNESGMRKLPQK